MATLGGDAVVAAAGADGEEASVAEEGGAEEGVVGVDGPHALAGLEAEAVDGAVVVGGDQALSGDDEGLDSGSAFGELPNGFAVVFIEGEDGSGLEAGEDGFVVADGFGRY